jgi:hypothetical protein
MKLLAMVKQQSLATVRHPLNCDVDKLTNLEPCAVQPGSIKS